MHSVHKSLEKSKTVHVGRIRSSAASLIGALVLAAATLAGAAKAQAACDNYPVPDDFEAGDSIQCTEDSTSTDDIVIDASDLTINTAADDADGIEIKHGGTGNIHVKTSGLTISTTLPASAGIDVSHTGSGNILIESQMDSITTTADSSISNAPGIAVRHNGLNGGDIVIRTVGTTIQTGQAGQNGSFGIGATAVTKGKVEVDISGGSITTLADGGTGIILWHEYGGPGRAGDTTLNIHNDASITTLGDHAPAVLIIRKADGKNKTDLEDVTISTTGENSFGVSTRQDFTGNIDLVGDIEVNLLGGVSISTAGAGAHGVEVRHPGENTEVESHAVITARGRNTITTSGAGAVGLRAFRGFRGAGNTRIDLQDISIITKGVRSDGIYGRNHGTGDIDIDVRNSFITTESIASADASGNTLAGGIFAYHGGSGDIDIDTERVVIETKGVFSNGVYAYHEGAGNINLDIRGGSITTKGIRAFGIFGLLINSTGTGDIDLDVRNATIVTESIDLNPVRNETLSFGIYADNRGLGGVDIDVQGGSVETRGVFSYGVYGRLLEADHGGLLSIRTGGGHAITTTGANGHGIVAYNFGTLDTSTIDINVGGSIETTGAGSQGVRVGSLSSGAPARVAAMGTDGFRKQTVTVNGSVMGNAAGIFLAGGGRVVIGPRGSVGAISGIAILATGEVPADTTDPNNEILAIKPKLRVDLNLRGRRVAQAIGDNWIINDGGETTIAVNGVVLHDGVDGVDPDHTAPNGAWNVRMLKHGVKLDDYTNSDPSMWTRTQSTVDDDPIIADRDFSANDFTETAVPPCPPGRIGRHPNCRIPPPPPPVELEPEPEPEPEPETEPGPEAPMFIEEYAPRAALYEVLPDFMLRMQNWAPTRQHLSLPESPVYIRLLGNTGSQEFKRSTVNANYDAGRFAVEAGVNIPLFENFDIWASMHHVTGSAEVSSPVNGGDIDVTGSGLSLDAYWSGENDYYATGRLSLTDYDIDLSSNTIGRLKSNGDANGQSVHVEAGRRMTLSENSHWTPRAWLGHTRISVDKFTDAVDSRVSFPTTDRLTGGLGVMVESVRTEYGGGELLLRGSLDFEQKFGDSETVALVSGERLSAEPEKNSAFLSLGGTWHKGSFTYSAELSARQDLHSGGEDYSGVIHVGMRF